MRKPTVAMLCAWAMTAMLLSCSDDPKYDFNIQHQFGVIHDPEPPKQFLPNPQLLANGEDNLRKWASVKIPLRDTAFAITDTVTYKQLVEIHKKLSDLGFIPDWELEVSEGTYALKQTEHVYCPVYKKYGKISHGEGVYFCTKDKKMNDFAGIGGRWVLFADHIGTDRDQISKKCPHDHD